MPLTLVCPGTPLVVVAPRGPARLLTARHQVEPVGVHGEAGDGVQVGHHGVDELAAVVVVELDVAVLLGRDGDGQRGVAQHLVDLAGRGCNQRGGGGGRGGAWLVSFISN